VADTGTAFSLVLLDRFAVTYPRVLTAEEERLEGHGFDWYRDKQTFLIAGREKALVDCLYLSVIGV
jgi:hypothetical protein